MTERDCNSCASHVQGDIPSMCRGCLDATWAGTYLPLWKPKETMTTPQAATMLPSDAAARKAVPIFSGVLRYFPDAIAAIAACSRKGNDQHNPGKPLHWDRSKSGDELDALTRHLMEAGTIDTDAVRHSTKVAWRALANLQKELEAEARAEPPEPMDAVVFKPTSTTGPFLSFKDYGKGGSAEHFATIKSEGNQSGSSRF